METDEFLEKFNLIKSDSRGNRIPNISIAIQQIESN